MTRSGNEINEDTKVSLFPTIQALWAVGLSAIPLIFFLALLYFKTDAAAGQLEQHSEAIKDFQKDLIDIKTSLARIEERLGIPHHGRR